MAATRKFQDITDKTMQGVSALFKGQEVQTSWPLKMGPIGCPETSVQNCHSTLRNIPKEGRPHLHRGGSLKSRNANSTCTSVVHSSQEQKKQQRLLTAIWVQDRTSHNSSSARNSVFFHTKYLLSHRGLTHRIRLNPIRQDVADGSWVGLTFYWSSESVFARAIDL
jgi:hypothetical protein